MAQTAQAHAEECRNNLNFNRATGSGFSIVGENLASSQDSTIDSESFEAFIQEWYDQGATYDPATGRCSATTSCGEFIQVYNIMQLWMREDKRATSSLTERHVRGLNIGEGGGGGGGRGAERHDQCS